MLVTLVDTKTVAKVKNYNLNVTEVRDSDENISSLNYSFGFP